MGMFKVAVGTGIKAAAINVEEEMARHRANPQGAVLDNLQENQAMRRPQYLALGALLGGGVGGLGGFALGGPGGAGLGALGGGIAGAVLGGPRGMRRAQDDHEAALRRILSNPEQARIDAARDPSFAAHRAARGEALFNVFGATLAQGSGGGYMPQNRAAAEVINAANLHRALTAQLVGLKEPGREPMG